MLRSPKRDRAGIRCHLAGDLTDQGGLAGAVGADQRMQLALAHLKRDAVRSNDAVEALGQFLNLQQGIRHEASSDQRCATTGFSANDIPQMNSEAA
jgi:hypothetical protein